MKNIRILYNIYNLHWTAHKTTICKDFSTRADSLSHVRIEFLLVLQFFRIKCQGQSSFVSAVKVL